MKHKVGNVCLLPLVHHVVMLVNMEDVWDVKRNGRVEGRAVGAGLAAGDDFFNK